jgi:hypothetical protein
MMTLKYYVRTRVGAGVSWKLNGVYMVGTHQRNAKTGPVSARHTLVESKWL